jgi:hypothetical protein
MRARTCSLLAISCIAAMFAGSAGAAAVLAPDADEDDLVPTGKGWGERSQHSQGKGNGNGGGAGQGLGPGSMSVQGANGINYHGGPLILGTANVYYIWYGNWSGNTAPTILGDFAASIGGSPYYNINTTYYNGASVKVSNSVRLAGSIADSYSQGANLSDSQIRTVVANALSSGKLPKDSGGVYFVLTSADVNATSGFCTQYCGWHAHGTMSGLDIKYSFVGNPDRCPNACAAQPVGPNGNAGADGMASVIAHELEEAVTDPDLNAWYDRRGYENADKCAWSFGTQYTTANGAKANMKLGARDYLIQRNWVNASGGYCALQYP